MNKLCIFIVKKVSPNKLCGYSQQNGVIESNLGTS